MHLAVVVSLLGVVHTNAAHASQSVQEKATTLDEVFRLADRLRAAGINVAFTRTDDRDVPLSTRAHASDGHDLLLSIHNNGSPSKNVVGTEAYYQIGNSAGGNLAWDIVDAIVARAGTVKRGAFTRRGDNGDYYAVLREAPTTSIIVEGEFLSNSGGARKLSSSDFRQRIADGVADAVINRMAMSWAPQGAGPPAPKGSLLPAPGSLAATDMGAHAVKVTWSVVGLATSYEVWRDGTYAGTVTGQQFDDAGLAPGRHRYEVRAVAALPNGSVVQESKSATTDVVVPWRVVLDAGHGGKDPGAVGHF